MWKKQPDKLADLKHTLKLSYLCIRGNVLNFISKYFIKKRHYNLLKKPEKILIITPPRIGDVAISFSALYSFKKAFPCTHLDVLANDYTSFYLNFIKVADNILILHKVFLKVIGLIIKIKKERYDLIIDLNFDYHILPALIAGIGGNYSSGYNISGRGFLFNKCTTIPDIQTHASDIFFRPIKQVFPSALKLTPWFKINHIKTETFRIFMSELGITQNNKLIIIHPGAHHPTQRWLPRYFAETADKIKQIDCVKLVLVGGSNEKYLLKKILTFMKNKPDIIFTDLSIKSLILLINRSNLMICNNSGPLHIAVSTNTPTISFMGPTLKERWEPIGEIHKLLRMDDLPCIGCNKGYCKNKTHDCMRLLTPSIVFNEVYRFIS